MIDHIALRPELDMHAQIGEAKASCAIALLRWRRRHDPPESLSISWFDRKKHSGISVSRATFPAHGA